MIKKYFLIVFLSLSSFSFQAQRNIQLSVYSQVSVITIGPGEELYEKFGHSSIRIKDPMLRLDLIYDYGIFDFNAPNFYSNFTKGKLLYKVARYPFRYMLENKKEEKRWVKEQVLDLNQLERQQVFNYLENNVIPQNATYLYDPFYDNCATKIVDILKSILGNKVKFSDNHLQSRNSLRSLMNKEIYWNTWGSLGINIALGNKLDKQIDSKGYNYLPDYIYLALKNATLNDDDLVRKEEVLLDFNEPKNTFSLTSPFSILFLFSLIGLFITYKDFKNDKRSKWLDFLLFFSTGLIGVLIVFLWFFTNHSTTPNNFNFLWAFAPNLLVSFILLKNQLSKWFRKYTQILILLLLLIPISWLFGIQSFSLTLIPLLILLLVRFFFLLTFKK